MKKTSWLALAFATLSLSGCKFIGDIFKAGVGVGVFIVIAVIAVIIFILAKVFGGGSGNP